MGVQEGISRYEVPYISYEWTLGRCRRRMMSSAVANQTPPVVYSILSDTITVTDLSGCQQHCCV